jgi:hypothetical protein
LSPSEIRGRNKTKLPGSQQGSLGLHSGSPKHFQEVHYFTQIYFYMKNNNETNESKITLLFLIIIIIIYKICIALYRMSP